MTIRPFEKICMMIHAGRVGSTVVGTRLCTLPIFAAGEIHNVNVNKCVNWADKWDYVDMFEYMLTSASTRESPYGHAVPGSTGRLIYLFEYKPYHYGCGEDIQKALTRFAESGVTDFVFLSRSNYLRRYISFLVAVSSGIWHTSTKLSAPHKVKIDVRNCADTEIGFRGGTLIQAIDHYYNHFIPSVEAAITPHHGLVLTYEEHVEPDPEIAVERIRTFLSIESSIGSQETRLIKQNRFPLAEIIENYDEVANVLTNSGHEALLT